MFNREKREAVCGQPAPRQPCAPSAALQEWLAAQQVAVRREGQLARAQGAPVVLPPTTPSLDQAGGLQRLALRGHRGSVTHVLLTPSGTDAVTGGCGRRGAERCRVPQGSAVG